MTWKVLLVFLLLTTGNTLAQKIEIFGYFEPQLMVAKIQQDYYQLSSNKLRVDLQSKVSSKVTFGANFDYITYHGKTQWDLLALLPEKILAEVPDFDFFGQEFNPYILPFEARQFLDNAYLKLAFKYADIIVGKQQLSFGTGYVWNPTDVFNQKDPADPTYEQPGHNACRIDIPIKNRLTVTGIYAPTDDWKKTDFLLKLKSGLAHFDVSLLALQKQWKFTDARLFDPVMLTFYQVNTKRQVLGGDLVGELFGLGVWSEFAYNKVRLDSEEKRAYQFAASQSIAALNPDFTLMEIEPDYYEWVVGCNYTFDFQTYFMLEFYRNTLAKSTEDGYRFNDWMQFMLGETKTITRDQLYIYLQHPMTDLITIGCASIVSLADKSYAFIPSLIWPIFQNVELTFYGNIYLGKAGTAYANNLGNGAIFRARVYF